MASERANRSAKKVVKVRKSATKKRSNKTQSSESPSRRQSSLARNSSSNDTSDLAYSVLFGPGSIGLKLEPVVESMGREVGCRVLDFADGGQQDPGQARKTGRIRLGDLLVAINGRDVISWNYPDIIALLRQTAQARERNLAFRSVWTPTESAQYHSHHTLLPSPAKQEKAVEISATATPVRRRELTTEDFALTQSPAEAVLHSHFLSGFGHGEAETSQATSELKEDSAEELLSAPEQYSEENIDSKSVAPDIEDDDSCFSPSRVKELSMTGYNTNGRVSPPPPKPISNVVKTVYNSVAPAAGLVASSSYSLTSTLTSAMSVKLGEALVGHKSKDFDSAIQLKMQLLSELSQAKVTLDRNLEEQRRLEALGLQLTEERDSERQAKKDLNDVNQQLTKERDLEREVRENVESELTIVKKEKVSYDDQKRKDT
jgi:hypothetical protein